MRIILLIFGKRSLHALGLGIFAFTTLSAQSIVKGTVRDVSGEPLPGVSVVIVGTTQGTTTDGNGQYSIALPRGDEAVIFSFIGYKKKELKPGTLSVLDVVLEEDVTSLEEVIVVGYGEQRKIDVTGSISSIEGKVLEGTPLKSVDETLQGRAAGVMFTQNSGMPGAGSVIRIRGGNSINGGNEPLYVIDGVPVYGGGTTSQAGLNPLNSLSISDIESIEVLKDASSTSIYGSRGGNGVILITTKRGKANESTVQYNSYVSSQVIRKRYELLDAHQYEVMSNEAFTNEGGARAYDESLIPPTTDWQSLVLRSALTHNHDLSFSGGDEKTRYLFTLSYLDQDGIIKESGFQRYSMRLNLDRTISERIAIGNSLTFSRTNTDRVNSTVYERMLTAPPNVPIKQPDGSYTEFDQLGNPFANPVQRLYDFSDINQASRLLGNVFATVDIAKGLRFKTLWGIDATHSKRETYVPYTATGGPGDGTASAGQNYIWLNENTLNYNYINDTHRLDVLAGFTRQGSAYESLQATGYDFENDNLQMNALQNASEYYAETSKAEWFLTSFLGRVNYGFRDKYLLTVTGRYDGSSRFGSNNRFGFFPSAAIGWRAVEEDFIKNLNIFSDLKIRLSHGITGNQDGIGNYPSMTYLERVNYSLNDQRVLGMKISSLGNPDLKWESTTQTDLGLEMGFFNNRLTITADAYYKKTKDLLLAVKIPSTSGYTSALKNIGKIENKGVELTLEGIPMEGDFNWTVGFNISFNRNKILDLGGEQQILPTNGGPNNSSILKVGDQLGAFYGYISEGVFQTVEEALNSTQPSAKPGDIRFKNLNSDNVFNESDRTIIGNAQPVFFGGLNNSFSYKGFDLSFLVRFSYGNDIYNYNRFNLESLNGIDNNSSDVLNRWTRENRDTKIPRASSVKQTSRSWDRLIEDGSYLRLKFIQLGYNFPVKLLGNRIQAAKLYVTGENLITLTHYSGYDPEISSYGSDNIRMGYDTGVYPTYKSFVLGLNLKF